MSVKYPYLVFFKIFLCFVYSGCSMHTYYIHDEEEFNRSSSIFLNGIEDRENVTVCSSNFSEDMSSEIQLAESECALFNKKAVFTKASYSECPLFTPRAILFNCQNVKKINK